MSKGKYKRGKHPHSKANLVLSEGRPPLYSEEKKRRTLTVTEKGWDGAKLLVDELGCTSISDFIEKLGRGKVKVKISA